MRLEHHGWTESDVWRTRQPPVIAAFWHNRIAYPAWFYRGPRYAAIISHHRDGDRIARCVAGFGTHAVRGATAREGAPAFLEACRLLERGVMVGVTPDGPLGPRYRAQPGTIALASRSGAPVVALSYSVTRSLVFRSWDRFILPLPFARAAVELGEPLDVPPDLRREELEAWRRRLEELLERLRRSTDRRVERPFAHDGSG